MSNAIEFDYDGTASTDFDDGGSKKYGPQLLAVIARLQAALDKLDSALCETRRLLNGACTHARERSVIALIRDVCRVRFARFFLVLSCFLSSWLLSVCVFIVFFCTFSLYFLLFHVFIPLQNQVPFFFCLFCVVLRFC